MIALNDNTLFVGEIKQLLHNFNLPNCSVGFKNPAPDRHFIANGYINLWKEVVNPDTNERTYEYEKICPYKYNKKYTNLTTNLPIRNLLYDRETHRYLGKYLRFIRDFRNVNLMSMYNCFDGEIFEGDVSVRRRLKDADNDSTNTIVRFKHNYEGFSIYSVPVDFQKLTLRISDGTMAYICLCIDTVNMLSSSRDSRLNQELMDVTLRKFHANEVMNYDPADCILKKINSNRDNLEFSTSDILEFVAKNIKNLKLLIKVTKKNDVKITVLEGTFQINQTLLSDYFIIEPLKTAYIPLLFPRYIDVADESQYNEYVIVPDPTDEDPNATKTVYIDSDGHPVDFSDGKGDGTAFNPENNDIRFGLVQSSADVNDLYEIVFVQYLVDPVNNAVFKNPINLEESGFLIIPQLLQQNDTMNDQYMLADRMIEYLSGNVICPLSEDYDIRRMQLAYARNGYDFFNRKIDDSKYVYGIWSCLDLYNTRKIIANNYNRISNIYDMLGYLDKDVEKILGDQLDVV